MTEDPATDPRTRDLGCWLCSVEKGVVSMKAEPGRDILVLISATLIQSMLAAGLVDDLRLAVVAVLLGGGAAQAAGRRVGRLGPGVVDDPA